MLKSTLLPTLCLCLLKDYIACAKLKPGQLTLAASGAGTAVHMSGLTLAGMLRGLTSEVS